MRYKSRPRGGGRRPSPDDSFGDRSEIPIEPLRSMTLGDDSSSDGVRGRFDDGQSTDSGDLRSSGAWVRPEPGWEDQPSGFRRRSRWSSSGILRRGGGGGGQSIRSRILIGVAAALVLLVGTFAVASRQHSGGDNTGSPAIVPASTSAAPIGVPSFGNVPSGSPSGSAPVSAPASALPSVSLPPSLASRPPSKAPARKPSPLVMLDTLRPTVSADGASGRRATAVIGTTTFPDSTSVFVSCSDRAA